MSVCTSEGWSTPTISVGVVRTLLDAVEDANVPRIEFLRAARLDPARIDGPEGRISSLEVYRLCELALALTREPAFGLRWADRLHGGTLGPLSHLIMHAGTLRQGFEAIAKFYRLLSDFYCHELIEHEGTATLRFRSFLGSPSMQRFAAEITAAFFFRIIRTFDRHAPLHSVAFKYPAPGHRAEYARVFEGRERFEQPFTGIVFDRALLDRPAPHKDDDMHEALQALAERRLVRMAHHAGYALRVREELVRQGLPLRSDMTAVARALGMSPRSLRRRLISEGKSYNAVVAETLTILAKRLLRGGRTIQETAYEMGFSDPRAFYRAFKRWTGTTPSTFLDQSSPEQTLRSAVDDK